MYSSLFNCSRNWCAPAFAAAGEGEAGGSPEARSSITAAPQPGQQSRILLERTQAAPQEQLEQLVQRVNDITAEKTRLELTINDLQSEHSRVKTSQAENKIELETYEKLYQEELNVVKSLSNELRRTMEMTAEVSAQLTAEKEKTRYPATASTTRPFLVSPVGNLSEGLNRRHIGRESRSSDESMESFMLRVSYIIFFPLVFRFLL
ncbi:putative coiled-coil domain-containing protein 144C isoform X1 [Callithrix jacchus]